MARVRKQLWYFNGCIVVSVCTMLTFIKDNSSVMRGISAGTHFLKEMIVHTEGSSGLGF